MKVIAILLSLVATASAFAPARQMPFTRVVMNNEVSSSANCQSLLERGRSERCSDEDAVPPDSASTRVPAPAPLHRRARAALGTDI